jgi:hypothetical protein
MFNSEDKCIVRHSYRASENIAVESCLDDVAACDLYIGTLGLRYTGMCRISQRIHLTASENTRPCARPRAYRVPGPCRIRRYAMLRHQTSRLRMLREIRDF